MTNRKEGFYTAPTGKMHDTSYNHGSSSKHRPAQHAVLRLCLQRTQTFARHRRLHTVKSHCRLAQNRACAYAAGLISTHASVAHHQTHLPQNQYLRMYKMILDSLGLELVHVLLGAGAKGARLVCATAGNQVPQQRGVIRLCGHDRACR